MKRFFTRCLSIAFTMFVHVSERENFFHQILANLRQNATGIVGFLKTFRIWGFFGKILNFFSKSLNVAKVL